MLRLILLSAVGFILGYNLSSLLPKDGIEQPFAFNHEKHRVMGCTLCHTGATAGAKAGFPAVEVCQKCHAISPLPDAKFQEAWKQAESGNPLLWLRLAKVPTHVYFSHNRHILLAGLNCEQCHGMISTTVKPPSSPLKEIAMNNCLDCHIKNNVSQDCAACHR